ncbi:MAG: hypothetical protein ACXWXZ_16165, partial [Candidatus Binatia bacterium]
LRKYTCSDDLRIDNDSLFRHTGAGRYPSPSRPWMPACAGMTNLRNEPREGIPVFSCSVDERNLMKHFVVKTLSHLVAACRAKLFEVNLRILSIAHPRP